MDPRGRAAGQVRSAASIAPEAARRLDRDDLVEIKIDNYLQGFAGGALLQIFGQGVEPGAIFGLQGGEDSDGITPALGTAASVDSLPVTEYRPDCSADGAMPGLALGIGQRSVAERAVGHWAHSKALRNGTGRGVLHEIARSGAVFEAPGLVAGFDDFAVMREAVEQCRSHHRLAEHDLTPQYRNDCHQ